MSIKSMLVLFIGLVGLTIHQSAARPVLTDPERDSDLSDPLCEGEQWFEPSGESKHNKPNPNCIPHERKKQSQAPSPSQAPQPELIVSPSAWAWPVVKPPTSSQAPSSPQASPPQEEGKPAFSGTPCKKSSAKAAHQHP
ncbi:hypothetical protein ACH5RR_033044 [Cinchona calisaya]|uniref:Uncharacterized protein n=1 Tax=Cinchona calisaya TaxID=153742 RepID=A0ABD2YP81_9GENT